MFNAHTHNKVHYCIVRLHIMDKWLGSKVQLEQSHSIKCWENYD